MFYIIIFDDMFQLTTVTNTSAMLVNNLELDFEDEKVGMGQNFNLTVEITDTHSPAITLTQTYSVQIINVNEAPTNVSLSSR